MCTCGSPQNQGQAGPFRSKHGAYPGGLFCSPLERRKEASEYRAEGKFRKLGNFEWRNLVQRKFDPPPPPNL